MGFDDLPKWAQKTLEQVAHFAAGFLISAVTGSPIFSVAIGVAREVFQNWGDKDNDYLDMATDLWVWTIGAVLASAVF